MNTRTLMSLVITASLAGASLAQAASPRPASGPRVDAAQPLCGGNGTKTPPEGPTPPKEPPKT
ncbi:MAG TPA: hypothetical protein VH062_16105 [Polyangiaceae bacterium]|jgi:hypothetical protein|nr:hypothetical protein [Polyangiaceae bacterium]